MFSLTIRKVVVREREKESGGNWKGNGWVRAEEEWVMEKVACVRHKGWKSCEQLYISLCVFAITMASKNIHDMNIFSRPAIKFHFLFIVAGSIVCGTTILLRGKDTRRIRIDNKIMNVNTWNYIQIKLVSSYSFFYYFCITFTRKVLHVEIT